MYIRPPTIGYLTFYKRTVGISKLTVPADKAGAVYYNGANTYFNYNCGYPDITVRSSILTNVSEFYTELLRDIRHPDADELPRLRRKKYVYNF